MAPESRDWQQADETKNIYASAVAPVSAVSPPRIWEIVACALPGEVYCVVYLPFYHTRYKKHTNSTAPAHFDLNAAFRSPGCVLERQPW